MRIHYLLTIAVCACLLIPSAAQADLKYFPDPAYKRLNKDDPPPMSDMVDLANEGDPRAMFILGDMCEKGKGGLMQDRKQARQWFEEAAMRDYSQAFIRLAAMAKHDKNPKEAWQWYTLAINSFDSGDAQDYAIRARKELVKTAGLTSEDLDEAGKAMDDWKEASAQHLRDAKKAAEEKERLQKEQAAKDAANSSAVAAAQAEQDKKTDQQENDDEQN